MLVTLLEDLPALGTKGAIVTVPDLYATSFLFPQFLAVRSTEREKIEQLTPIVAETGAVPPEIKVAQTLMSELDGLEVNIPVLVKNGEIKTPVGATEIRSALKELGIKISKSILGVVKLTELGAHDVKLSLPAGFEALLRVNLEPQT